MPTAGKLVAAIVFGALAWFVTELCHPLFPDAREPTYFVEITIGFGILMGWIVAGSRAGMGISAAIGYGLTTSATIVFWSLFGNSSVEMIERSLDKRYDGPVEAVVSIFEIGIEMGGWLATPTVIGVLAIGGIFAALFVDAIGRRYS